MPHRGRALGFSGKRKTDPSTQNCNFCSCQRFQFCLFYHNFTLLSTPLSPVFPRKFPEFDKMEVRMRPNGAKVPRKTKFSCRRRQKSIKLWMVDGQISCQKAGAAERAQTNDKKYYKFAQEKGRAMGRPREDWHCGQRTGKVPLRIRENVCTGKRKTAAGAAGK